DVGADQECGRTKWNDGPGGNFHSVLIQRSRPRIDSSDDRTVLRRRWNAHHQVLRLHVDQIGYGHHASRAMADIVCTAAYGDAHRRIGVVSRPMRAGPPFENHVLLKHFIPCERLSSRTENMKRFRENRFEESFAEALKIR